MGKKTSGVYDGSGRIIMEFQENKRIIMDLRLKIPYISMEFQDPKIEPASGG